MDFKSSWTSYLLFVICISQYASQHGGQDGYTSGSCQGHLGGWSATDLSGVALVCGTAAGLGHWDTQQAAGGGHVAASGYKAALGVGAHRQESWGQIIVLDSVQ